MQEQKNKNRHYEILSHWHRKKTEENLLECCIENWGSMFLSKTGTVTILFPSPSSSFPFSIFILMNMSKESGHSGEISRDRGLKIGTVRVNRNVWEPTRQRGDQIKERG